MATRRSGAVENLGRLPGQLTMDSTDNNKSPAVEFRNVFLSFDDQPAVVDISFQLYEIPHLANFYASEAADGGEVHDHRSSVQ